MTELMRTISSLRKQFGKLENQVYQIRNLYPELEDKERVFRVMAEHAPQGILVTKHSSAYFL